MSYYDTIDDDVKAAKEILARAIRQLDETVPQVAVRERLKAIGVALATTDTIAAYKLLESFVDLVESYRLLLAIMDADDYKAAVLRWKAQRDERDTAVRHWAESMQRNLTLQAEIDRLRATEHAYDALRDHMSATTRCDVPDHAALRAALIKVRAHTSYPDIPNLVLLDGLLKSIERITDAALGEHPQSPDSGSK